MQHFLLEGSVLIFETGAQDVCKFGSRGYPRGLELVSSSVRSRIDTTLEKGEGAGVIMVSSWPLTRAQSSVIIMPAQSRLHNPALLTLISVNFGLLTLHRHLSSVASPEILWIGKPLCLSRQPSLPSVDIVRPRNCE
ncbi:hypothetical protein H9L39_14821 [Fusarium oxysporum f. sp. albedinis]|nr:hypothetical protein H9L39_14821 [Fusarium oxysporum f. sp. albedinis]